MFWRDGKSKEIFGPDESHFLMEEDENSNWMKFIKISKDSTNANLTAFARNGMIFYATNRRVIHAGEELIVSFPKSFAVNSERNGKLSRIITLKTNHRSWGTFQEISNNMNVHLNPSKLERLGESDLPNVLKDQCMNQETLPQVIPST